MKGAEKSIPPLDNAGLITAWRYSVCYYWAINSADSTVL